MKTQIHYGVNRFVCNNIAHHYNSYKCIVLLNLTVANRIDRCDNHEEFRIGDFLYLETASGDKVAGFIKSMTFERVKLSHEFPTNEMKYGNWYFPHFTIGDREYPLNQYTKYKVVDLSNITLGEIACHI